jgi:hypothetical protein
VQILSNEKLIKTRSDWSQRLMLLGFGLILASAVITFANPQAAAYILPAYAALFGGFIVFNIGATSAAKWRNQPRADQALAKTLKGLDNRYILYNFLLPADHVLLTPVGINVFQVRRMPGVISVNGAKWSSKRSLASRLRFGADEQVGDPTRDVQQDVAALRDYLEKKLPDMDVPIEPLILFSSPTVQLSITDPTVPVLTAKDAKTYVRQAIAQGNKLDTPTFVALADLFDSAEGAEEAKIPIEPDAPKAKARRAKKNKP